LSLQKECPHIIKALKKNCQNTFGRLHPLVHPNKGLSPHTILVTTLTLGLRPRQGVGRWRAKRKAQESLRMPMGVQRVWGHEPSHSQINSHVGSWSPKRTPKSSECNYRGQNASPWSVLYIIEKLLKRRCLKWARIAHLDIYNASYGQKNGRESNWQFDSRPLKIWNRPDFLMCRQRATYRWKALDKGYNFASDLIMIGGLHKKLCALNVAGVSADGISDLGVLGQKVIWMWPLWRGTKYL
jgi:hypothetical protein